MMKGRLFVGGGQEYYGPTAARDKLVVVETAKELFNLVGNSIEIVTGGMPGIPDEFCKGIVEFFDESDFLTKTNNSLVCCRRKTRIVSGFFGASGRIPSTPSQLQFDGHFRVANKTKRRSLQTLWYPMRTLRSRWSVQYT